MRVLVSGAAGFLGSHLVDALLAEGNSVLGVDNLCTGSLQNIDHLKSETRFDFLERDICAPFDPGRVDYVFNFASPASPQDYLKLGVETLMTGSTGSCGCRARMSICRSTSGIPTNGPFWSVPARS